MPSSVDPQTCAKNAREAVRTRWRAIADEVRGSAKSVLATDVDEVWNEQIEETLEFYAVWTPLADGYKAARQAVEQALSGRKNLRDFQPWHHERVGAPKSSLDGARVSVLSDNRDNAQFRRLRISSGEQLDAIGLVKRAGFEPEQFVPLVNIAAGEWLARATRYAPEELDALRGECEQREIPAIRRPDLPVVTPFHYDASVLYPSRWAALFKELSRAETNAEAARQWGEKHVRPLLKRMREAGQGEPPVYVACLAADGDRMGAAIDCLVSAEANREFSRELAKFPLDARGIVEQEHLGSLIYAGGDDVLAFLPVAKAPHCAAALAKVFRDRLQGKVTLSVGIGVAHVIEPMSVLLQLARGAERAAKDADRDALAIIVDKRSGGQRRLAMQWRSDPVGRLSKDARLLDEKLSTGKVYELEALLRRFPNADQAKARPEAAQALAAYANDILSHASEGKGALLTDLGVEVAQDYAQLRGALAVAIDRILVVRSLREWGFA